MKTKILGVIEVSLYFVLAIYLIRALQSNPLAAKINTSFNGFLFSEYTALLVISIPLYYFRGRTQTKMSWSKKMGYQREILALGFFPFFILSVLLTWTDWTQWPGAIMISLIEIGLLIWFAWMVRHKQPAWHLRISHHPEHTKISVCSYEPAGLSPGPSLGKENWKAAPPSGTE